MSSVVIDPNILPPPPESPAITSDTPTIPPGTPVTPDTVEVSPGATNVVTPPQQGQVQITPEFIAELKALQSVLNIALNQAGIDLTISLRAPSPVSTTNELVVSSAISSDGNPIEMGGFVFTVDNVNGITYNLRGGQATTLIEPARLAAAFPAIARFFKITSPSNALSGSGDRSSSSQFKASSLNTASELSQGDDLYYGTGFNDGILLSTGKDAMAGYGGDDFFAAISSIKGAKSSIYFDGDGTIGKNTLLLTKQSLRQGGAKLTIEDFANKSDTIAIEAKKSKVDGIGTTKLKISTKDGNKIVVKSSADKFKSGDIEFI